jgi:hypothetical protein
MKSRSNCSGFFLGEVRSILRNLYTERDDADVNEKWKNCHHERLYLIRVPWTRAGYLGRPWLAFAARVSIA